MEIQLRSRLCSSWSTASPRDLYYTESNKEEMSNEYGLKRLFVEMDLR